MFLFIKNNYHSKIHISENKTIMKRVDKELLKVSAHKLMFDMSEEEYDALLNEFSILLKQLDFMGDIPHIDEVEPMTFPFEITTTYLREDVATEPLDREEALKNASDVVDGQIRLPKVVK